MNNAQEKVTIYYQGVMGMQSVEGRLVSHSKSGIGSVQVDILPKRCRRVRRFSSIYCSHILVVRGWGHPAPDSPWSAPEQSGGCTVQRSRYSSCDPRWGSEFDAKIAGAGLEIIADYR